MLVQSNGQSWTPSAVDLVEDLGCNDIMFVIDNQSHHFPDLSLESTKPAITMPGFQMTDEILPVDYSPIAYFTLHND